MDRDGVICALAQIIENDRSLLNILLYLGQEEEKKQGCENSGIWRILSTLADSNIEVLKNTALKAVSQIDTEKRIETLEELHNRTTSPFGNIDVTSLSKFGSIGFCRSWNVLSTDIRAKLQNAISYELYDHRRMQYEISQIYSHSNQLPTFKEVKEVAKKAVPVAAAVGLGSSAVAMGAPFAVGAGISIVAGVSAVFAWPYVEGAIEEKFGDRDVVEVDIEPGFEAYDFVEKYVKNRANNSSE